MGWHQGNARMVDQRIADKAIVLQSLDNRVFRLSSALNRAKTKPLHTMGSAESNGVMYDLLIAIGEEMLIQVKIEQALEKARP